MTDERESNNINGKQGKKNFSLGSIIFSRIEEENQLHCFQLPLVSTTFLMATDILDFYIKEISKIRSYFEFIYEPQNL